MIALLFVLGIVALIASIILIVQAFGEGVGWGLGVMFLPFCSFVFVCTHWERARNPFLVRIFCSIAMLGIILTNSAGATNILSRFARAKHQTPNGELSKYETLTKEIGEKKLALVDTQMRYEEEKNSATTFNTKLSNQRKALNERDPAAVRKFNSDLEVYKAQLASLRKLENEMAAAGTEITELSDLREKTPRPVATRHKVVLYTTSSCPYCNDAKAYLARRGIQYENHQVDQSREEYERFKNLGGNGVPLIYVDNERLDGYSEEWMNQRLQ